MANTGWKITRSLVFKSTTGIPLDKNGLPCTNLDNNGVPVSITGLRQAAYVWDGLESKILTEGPPGQTGVTKSYGTLYDIQDFYSITFPSDPATTNKVYFKGVLVAEYLGYVGQDCEVPTYRISAEPTTLTLSSNRTNINITVRSTYGSNFPVAMNYSILYPSWIIDVVDDNQGGGLHLISASVLQNTTGGPRFNEITFTQSMSGNKVVVTINQAG